MSVVPLECVSLTKAFGGVPVLKDVSLTLRPGTVTALVGENGAGKSTLIKIASGFERADAGTLHVNGVDVSSASPHAVHRAGAAMVPQELAPILDMKVYENLFLGREVRNRLGLLDRKQMAKRGRELLEALDVRIDPDATMRSLSVGLTQLVEIVKATSGGAEFLMLDEPTSSLPEPEVARLLDSFEKLKSRGVTVLFTTHRMEEIRASAERVIVLRDGRVALDAELEKVTDAEIVRSTIGRDLEDLFPAINEPVDETCAEVKDFKVAGFESSIDLEVRRGEIVGLAGLVGAGRTEFLETLFGLREPERGRVRVGGRVVRTGSVAASISAGMALVPEDRKSAGLVQSMTVLDNGSLPHLKSTAFMGWVRQGARRQRVAASMARVQLRSKGLAQAVETLSGGNQQKVVFGRWLAERVSVLLLDEPTRGVDIGARSEIYRIITAMAAEGTGVIMASSDMPEVLSLAHRVLVFREGRVVASLDRPDLDQSDVQARIFRLASGLDEGGAGSGV